MRATACGICMVLLLASGCAPRTITVIEPAPPPVTRTLLPALPAEVGMDSRLTQRLDSLLQAAVADGASPGAAAAVGRHGRIVYLRGVGRTHHDPAYPSVDEHTLFDLASLTKVVATTTAAMLLE